MNTTPFRMTIILGTVMVVSVMGASNFDTNFVELDSSKMITTSDHHYAICNHNFPSNWRTVSVNGDEVTIATKDNHVTMKRLNTLSHEEKNSLETIKTKLMAVVRLGPSQVKSETGFAKLTTFDRNGGTSTMGTGNGSDSSGSASSSSSSSFGGTSISKTGNDSYIVTKTDFPFQWQRVFFNADVAAIVYKDKRVVMLPKSLTRPDERVKLNDLYKEVEKSAKKAEKISDDIVGKLKHPMDFVKGIFG